jgi:pullulanase
MNHVFRVQDNPLEILAPGYYFQHDAKGHLTGYSGCGNDVDSAKMMVKQLLVQTLRWYVETYDVDGFRFDLMGMFNVEIMNYAYYILKKEKPSLLFYGEGWDMNRLPSVIHYATIWNANSVRAGFFNDYYRESLYQVLYNTINDTHLTTILNGSRHLYTGNQSVNYFTCHDGYTLCDKLRVAYNLNLSLYEKVALIFTTQYLSKGALFIQGGDEFLRTKKGNHNSYNSGDEVNTLDFNLTAYHPEIKQLLKDLRQIRDLFFLTSGEFHVVGERHYQFRGVDLFDIFLTVDRHQTITFLDPKNLIFDGWHRRNEVVKEYKFSNIGYHIFKKVDYE